MFLRAARVGVLATDIGLKLTQVELRNHKLSVVGLHVVFCRAEPNHIHAVCQSVSVMCIRSVAILTLHAGLTFCQTMQV